MVQTLEFSRQTLLDKSFSWYCGLNKHFSSSTATATASDSTPFTINDPTNYYLTRGKYTPFVVWQKLSLFPISIFSISSQRCFHTNRIFSLTCASSSAWNQCEYSVVASAWDRENLTNLDCSHSSSETAVQPRKSYSITTAPKIKRSPTKLPSWSEI